MPGFVTHYIFGRETYHNLSSRTLKKNLYENRAAYSLGQQGPDIFFYYLPSYLLHGHNIGAMAHTRDTNAFFRGLLRSCLSFKSKQDKNIAEAYLIGFLGHYTLDTICHPYVYAMTHYTEKSNDYFERHAYLETDIDTDLLAEKLNRQPCSFHGADTIALTARQRKVIAQMLYEAYHYAFPTLRLHKLTMYLGIISMRLGRRLLHDDSGQKKAAARFLEKHLLGYPIFSPLIPSDTLFFRTDPFNLRHKLWRNPWDTSLSSTESFTDLYDKSEKLYLKRIRKLYSILNCEAQSGKQEQLVLDFLSDYGNNSFHSGLDVSIPS